MAREKTRYTGVYQRVVTDRKFNGGPDVAFDISFKLEGRKVWEKCGFASEGYSAKLASQIRAERMRSIRHGEEIPSQKKKIPKFEEAWLKYKEWAMQNKTRKGRDDIYLYNNNLQGRFSGKRLNEISPFDLERLKSDLLKLGKSPATAKHCLVLVRQIYNKMITWGLYEGVNPVRAVKMPALQNAKTRFLTHEEANVLLAELSTLKYKTLHDLSLMSLYSGLRAGELFNLHWNDLDFQNRLIRISDPKNKETRHAFMTEAIQEMLERRRSTANTDLVFPDTNGKQIVAISQSFRKVIAKLGFNDGISDPRQQITFHSLRHTFASWLALQGESLITIRDLLGHRTTAMTERYSHLLQDHKRAAAERLEKGFRGADTPNIVDKESKNNG